MTLKAGRPPTIPRDLRVYEVARTAHLERFASSAPAVNLYEHRNYDFDEGLANRVNARQASVVDIVKSMWLHNPAVIELNEPLLPSGWPKLALYILSARMIGRLRKSPVQIASYAIGNVLLDTYLNDRLPARAARFLRPVARRLGRRLVRQFDRLAFGTPDAVETYKASFGPDALVANSREFIALPAPCSCSDVGRERTGIVFLGSLEDRKGIRLLLDAWPRVQLRDPSQELHVMGKGPLTDHLLEWASSAANVKVTLDPDRSSIHQALRSARVLVLLSRREGLWREQIGLPILEGLAHGCTVVTTSETGLASWLGAHGHRIVKSDDVDEVVDAMTSALRAPVAPTRVRESLPLVDGRLQADQWMFRRP